MTRFLRVLPYKDLKTNSETDESPVNLIFLLLREDTGKILHKAGVGLMNVW